MPNSYSDDYAIFCSLKSPLNLLSRSILDGQLLRVEDSLTHYSKSQTSFAYHSSATLITLLKKFQPDEIFDLNSARISKQEINNVEKLYEFITNSRLLIAQNTSYTPDCSAKRQAQIISAMSYTNSVEQRPTNTILNHKYNKYRESTNLFNALFLDYIVSALGEDYVENDSNIKLGSIRSSYDEDKKVTHLMGEYREDFIPFGANDIEKERIEKINRVDEITALALKKSFQTQDKEESLKYTFLFGILRGYNLRSTTGACWAQEMSMRWVFAQKNWTQFRKMPGIYLDVEATMLGEDYPEKMLEQLVEKMITDYNNSINNNRSNDSLFDIPLPHEDRHFEQYLKTTKSFRKQLEENNLESNYIQESELMVENFRESSTLEERLSSYFNGVILPTILPPLFSRTMLMEKPHQINKVDTSKEVKIQEVSPLKDDSKSQTRLP